MILESKTEKIISILIIKYPSVLHVSIYYAEKSPRVSESVT
jgi:hypothetical protein